MIKYLVAVALAAASVAAQAQGFAMKNEGGVSWICAGVGLDEREALDALEAQANFKLLLVTSTQGAFVANVPVTLYRAGSKTPVLSVHANGPVCLFDLPAGRYRVESAYHDARRGAAVEVRAGRKRPARVVLSFPE